MSVPSVLTEWRNKSDPASKSKLWTSPSYKNWIENYINSQFTNKSYISDIPFTTHCFQKTVYIPISKAGLSNNAAYIGLNMIPLHWSTILVITLPAGWRVYRSCFYFNPSPVSVPFPYLASARLYSVILWRASYFLWGLLHLYIFILLLFFFSCPMKSPWPCGTLTCYQCPTCPLQLYIMI